MKKLFTLLLVLCAIIIIPTNAFADSVGFKYYNEGNKQELRQNILKGLKETKQQKLYKNIRIPSRGEIRQVLQRHFDANPKGNEHNIKKIDEIVESYIVYFNTIKEYDLATQDWRWYPHWHTWTSGPNITSSNRTKHYGPIQEFNNKGSALPITQTFSSKLTSTISVGFSGSAEIKEVISTSISASSSYTYEESVSSQVTIPARTYWSRRAYAYRKTDYYSGSLATWNLVPSGTGVMIPNLVEVQTHSGTNVKGDGGGIEYNSY